MSFPVLENFTLIAALISGMHFLGLLNAIDAVRTVRTSQGAIAWSISLVSIPYLAVPLYWIFGARTHSTYITTLKRAESAYKGDLSKHLQMMQRYQVTPDGDEDTKVLLERLQRWPITGGNAAKILIDGEQTFDAIFDAIDTAQHYILLQFYIVRDDDLGEKLKQKLIAKAKSGVKVYFLSDAIGSWALGERYRSDLRDAGVAWNDFRVSGRWINRLKLNFRNHRKIVVVDGKHAFIGGHNVGDEYLGKNASVGAWRDTHVRITGPAVMVVQMSFAGDWHWATGESIDVGWSVYSEGIDDLAVLPLVSGPPGPFETCSLFFQHAIASANKRLWIASPYFVPDEGILNSLQLAALRGVDVRVLLPLRPDHFVVWLASLSYYEQMLQAGVSLYRYDAGFLHQKVMLVDDLWASIGTANFDNRSFRLNFEISTLIFDTDFANQVAEMLESDFAKSDLVTEEEVANMPLPLSIASSVGRLFAPML